MLKKPMFVDAKNKVLTLKEMFVVMAIVLMVSGAVGVIMKAMKRAERAEGAGNTKLGAGVEKSRSKVDRGKIQIRLRNVSYPDKDPGKRYLNDYWRRRERIVAIPLNQTALILIDVWDTKNDRSKKVPLAEAIVRTKIAPLLKAAREADMLVIHAPHRSIGWDGINREVGSIRRGATSTGRDKLPKWVAKKEFHPLQWPPIEFIFRVGEYGQFARNNCPSYMPYTQILGINPDCLPLKRDREYIESSPEKVREILRKNKILHLFYAGGATNICVVQRPVGIRRMSLFGYNTIILRDATLGSELADTWDILDITKAAVLDIEINNGFSALSSDLLVELKRAAQNADVGDKRP